MTIASGGTLTKDVSMVLAPVIPGTLSGTVTSGGSPLVGVTVSVPGTGSVTTAANGTYSLAGITAGHLHRDLLQGRLRHPDPERDDHCRRHPDQERHARADTRARWPAP